VVCGAWASGDVSEFSPAAQDRFVAELKHLAPHAEVVVVDAGSSRTHFARRFWQAAGAVLVVTTCDSPAVMNAYAAIKTLAQSPLAGDIQTLVNLSDEAAEAEDIQARIATACKKFLAVRCAAAGFVPPCVAPRGPENVLIFPARSEASRALERVADTLWAQLQVTLSRETVLRRETQSAAGP
jgi:MinD-like ATPase involved in chromosome partitioning or flagellar assembly